MAISISFEPDARLVNELLALLSREQSKLVMIDIDAIEGLLEEKSVLLERINVTAKGRYNLLAANGFEPSEAGMQAWLKHASTPVLNRAWSDFQLTLNQAKEMNRLNGMLINKHFNRNQQLLNQLQGISNAGSVYGRDGQAKPASSSRPTLTA